ncbi:SDR family oxidoreductase [Devosia algicola]|uniref:SDR family oxidoreductase n=1 Tax=Devosia algicola TaxID=3026418 RepID=A0ABY7YRK2_9HYPH|nr:SDR family NAD(P)-dependent oxidoreductase [Devosia algicola]WDR03953.1 SDR family oxidoreductase [Devosia algicola]
MSILDKFDLSGKTALVTGAKRGIGRAMAEALAEAGADIIGVSATLDPANSAVGDAVRALGRDFSGYACDFSDRNATLAFARTVTAKHRVIDILINNAGTIKRAPAAEHGDDIWDEVVEVNLSAPFILTREIGRGMLARGAGKVIFTASILTFQGGITVPGYAATKGGVGQLVKAFANEWAGQGINVNAIAPGYVDTDNTAALRNDPDRSKSILDRIAAGRWGTSGDFAGPAVFLASEASSYMHGSIITVDGGWMGR